MQISGPHRSLKLLFRPNGCWIRASKCRSLAHIGLLRQSLSFIWLLDSSPSSFSVRAERFIVLAELNRMVLYSHFFQEQDAQMMIRRNQSG